MSEEMDQLTKAIEKLNSRMSLGYGFLHGIFVGLGTTVGVAIVLGLVGFVLQQIIAPHVPGFQDSANNLLQQLDQVKK